jgi:hypothetical protein
MVAVKIFKLRAELEIELFRDINSQESLTDQQRQKPH